jgi:hypothetical protein
VLGARTHGVLGPGEALLIVGAELDFDDDDPDPGVAVEQEDDGVGAVLGRADLGEVDPAPGRAGQRR